MSLKQRLAGRRAVIRTAVWSPPHSDGKPLARRHAFRLAAPSCDLAVLATLIARHVCHVAIIRRSWPPAKWGSSKLAAARRMLPRATLAADPFHVVHQAVKAVGNARRRVVRARYGRRGRSGDPEYGIKGLLPRNLEHPSAAQPPRSPAPWIATGTGRRSPPPGSPKKSRVTC
jgi:Transposase